MSDFKAIAEAVLKFSPMVATALGGPVAGMVTSLLANAFNVHPENLASTISQDPNAEFKLKQFEIEHSNDLAKINSANYGIEVDDRKNARDREVEEMKITGKRDWILDFIALTVIIGFFGLCIMNYFIKLSDDHVVTMLVGQISSGFMTVICFYFGSSKNN